jgi:hypothetical protein
MNKNAVIITTVGLIIGTAEDLIYYYLGQNVGGKFAYKVPPGKELLKTVTVVLISSILTAGISGFIESRFEDDKKQTA